MTSKTTVHPFLMFEGKAEEAMKFYVSLFPASAIIDVERYGDGGPAAAGSIKKARFTVAGQTVLCTDSYVKHGFTFTPAFSLFVTCESEEELRRLTDALAEGGATFMPVGNYGFSRMFAWVNDRFGVSWQLNLE